ncbi:unnamed protein product [Durusdinium trenchii]|uniref:Ribosomal RNA methyltransferase nop2 n=3 Tax=Durusdinium trenchii TaxID=1381693 RepID=A0ABP0I5M8_9DINO
MATLAAVAARPWRLLICGLRHGRPVESLKRLLEDFQPAAIFIELSREDFFNVRTRSEFADAAPECAEAIRWAERHDRTVIPLDRPQLSSRRRLAQKMALEPMQLVAARKFWGEVPEHLDPIAWRASLRKNCPALHEVILEERDELMTYRILLALESRLKAQGPRSRTGKAFHNDLPLSTLLERIRLREKSRLNDAMAWSLHPQKALRELPSWQDVESAQIDPDNILVLCGPAHVQELGHRLQVIFEDSAFSRRFLASNAALLPQLMTTFAEERSSHEEAQEWLLRARSFLESSGAMTEEKSTESAKGFGPLTMLANQVWQLLPQQEGGEDIPEPPLRNADFIQERLRELSKKPLPIWPVVLLAYIACPVLVFVLIPAAIDLQWIRIGPQVPSLLTDSEEEMSQQCTLLHNLFHGNKTKETRKWQVEPSQGLFFCRRLLLAHCYCAP